MNTEDFVTYEQAVVLKNMGFKEECLHYYKDSYDIPIILENVSSGNEVLLSDLYYSNNSDPRKRFCDAPTLTQVQKWLRKNRKISVEISSSVSLSNKILWRYNLVDLTTMKLNFSKTTYNSYEEALSAGITACI